MSVQRGEQARREAARSWGRLPAAPVTRLLCETTCSLLNCSLPLFVGVIQTMRGSWLCSFVWRSLAASVVPSLPAALPFTKKSSGFRKAFYAPEPSLAWDHAALPKCSSPWGGFVSTAAVSCLRAE